MKKLATSKILVISTVIVVVPLATILTTSAYASKNDEKNLSKEAKNIFINKELTKDEKIMYLSIASVSMFLVATVSLVIIIMMKNKITKTRIDQIKTTEVKLNNDAKTAK